MTRHPPPPNAHAPRGGNGSFGVVLSGADVRSWTFDERRRRLTRALQDSDGLVLIRGMTDLGPQEMVELSRAVGDEVEQPGVDERFLIPGWPEVQVIGNVKSEDGELRAMFSRAPPLPTKNNVETLQYDPELRSPVWHTDRAFRLPSTLCVAPLLPHRPASRHRRRHRLRGHDCRPRRLISREARTAVKLTMCVLLRPSQRQGETPDPVVSPPHAPATRGTPTGV